MIKLRLCALVSLLVVSGCAVAGPVEPTGRGLLYAAFDPDRNFQIDPGGGDDEMILTAKVSSQDYGPAYSLAIAYRCLANEKKGPRRCGYTARMLRRSKDEGQVDRSVKILEWEGDSPSASEMTARLDKAGLQWLEADVDACPKGIFAMDSVRVTNWRPDMHYALQAVEDREILLHPAMIHVRMSGSYRTSTFEGWVLDGGVPAAVQTLLDTLEPCWKPATAPRPWEGLAQERGTRTHSGK